MDVTTQGKMATAEPTNPDAAHYRENRSGDSQTTAIAAASNLAKTALEYAERGWRVIPLHSPTHDGCSCGNVCGSSGKHPRTVNGLNNASNDPATIRDWWNRWPDANIGIVTGPESGIFVLDIDGKQGEESLSELQQRNGHLPDTYTVRTGRGGRHFYFRWPGGGNVRNSAGRIGKGLDVRGQAGYVVAPPSLHASGARYEAAEPNSLPMECPGWLLSVIQGPQGAKDPQTALVAGAVSGESIGEGRRTGVLSSTIGKLISLGVPESDIRDTALALNRTFNPAQPELMVERMVSDMVKRYAHDESSQKDDSRPALYADDALALKFAEQHHSDLRFTAAWARWSIWTGSVWKPDETLKIVDLARSLCRAESATCGASEGLARKIASSQTIAAVERLARADSRHAATAKQWDAYPWLLNTPEGVVDLQNGELRPARREDYLTKSTAVAPGGECPTWLSFLARVTAGDRELQEFIQRVCGYALTGVTREQALFFLYGTGANGKSVFLDTICAMMGSYAKTAPIESFIDSRHQSHPTDLAGLQGARLVTAVEIEDGRRWAESKLKILTGGDRISARYMRQDFFEYTPQFKLLVAGNHKPELRAVDEAIRRRIHLLPFAVTIPAAERDLKLTEKLRMEWPGILQWAVDGCLAWQQDGLWPPASVTEATRDYFNSEDALGRWLEERCLERTGEWTSATALFLDWKTWAEANGEFVGSRKRLSEALTARGYTPNRKSNGRGFIGITLRAASVTDCDGSVHYPPHARARTPYNDAPVTPVTPSDAWLN